MRIPLGGPAQGQLVSLPPGEYDWIEVRFDDHAADPRGEVETTIWLHYADGADPEWLRRQAGARTCRIPVARHSTLVSLRLPDLPALHPKDLRLVAAARIKDAINQAVNDAVKEAVGRD
jgi:hypothetical protein